MSAVGPVDDIDALLASSPIVPEPSVRELLLVGNIHAFIRWEHCANRWRAKTATGDHKLPDI